MIFPTQQSPEQLHLLAQGERGDLEALILVLEARSIAYILDSEQQLLWVDRLQAAEAEKQIRLYQDENQNWPPAPKKVEQHPLMPPTVLLMGGLAIFYVFTGEWKNQSPWFVHGAVDATAVRQGEWWRLVTGLTLHADARHLLGNCLLGGVLVHLLSRVIGYGLAWMLLIACGVAGNWCNVILRQSAHLSVGFSTAVFAVVGLLSGLRMFQKKKSLWRDVLLPFGAGLSLLALLGTEGERTDLGAHFFGFLVGVVAGIISGGTPLVRWCRPKSRQRFFLVTSLSLVVLAWWCAFYPPEFFLNVLS
ncbi:rhomboid family intramembrane serine protease [Desulfobulbus rhabdoformis]|uniref:rhomboid family intramembrane serine protease n=1 Tax=Desulfobulbus rhabdoformis TaxID=34032 RepID=UPI0019656276|nr:rhomboid family intramembrane serine protease [Desulfobulbus rhabdoformis]MBM9613341.1 rhomboid family intramembrane serine protease [Desulfobulbus rhabdoformis]